MVSVAPVSALVAAKLAAVAAPKAVNVPVDTSPTVVKFPALAVLMVSVLPVIPVAELSRPTLAAPLMLSELPDTAPVDNSVAPATAPVAVSAAQETAPEASTPVVNTSVQFTSLRSSWSQPTLPCAVSPSSVAEPVRASLEGRTGPGGRLPAGGLRHDPERPCLEHGAHLHSDAGETLLLRLPAQAGHGLQLGDVRQRGRQRLRGRHRHLPRHALAGRLEHGAPGLLGAAGRPRPRSSGCWSAPENCLAW